MMMIVIQPQLRQGTGSFGPGNDEVFAIAGGYSGMQQIGLKRLLAPVVVCIQDAGQNSAPDRELVQWESHILALVPARWAFRFSFDLGQA